MDPVTGVLAPVVGASLDVWKRTVVPVTVSQILTLGENPDSVTVSEVELNHSCIKAHLASGRLYGCLFASGGSPLEGEQCTGQLLA